MSEILKIERRHHRMSCFLREELLDAGLSINSQQAILLFYFSERGEMAHNQIEYWGTNASYNLGSMVKRGYLAVREDEVDRRRQLYKLTDRGTELSSKLGPVFRSVEQQLEVTTGFPTASSLTSPLTQP